MVILLWHWFCGQYCCGTGCVDIIIIMALVHINALHTSNVRVHNWNCTRAWSRANKAALRCASCFIGSRPQYCVPLALQGLPPTRNVTRNKNCLFFNVMLCVWGKAHTAKTEGLKQPRLGYFSCSHKFC